MSEFRVEIANVVTNGPYAYWIFKDEVGQKSSDNVATISAALDGIKADVGGLLGTQTVKRVTMTIISG